MITGADPVALYDDFKRALRSPFTRYPWAAIPPAAALFAREDFGYSSSSTVSIIILHGMQKNVNDIS